MPEDQQLDLIEDQQVEASEGVETTPPAADPPSPPPTKEVEASEEVEAQPAQVEATDEVAQPDEVALKLKASNKALSKENTRLQSVIKGVLDNLTSSLTKEDKDLLAELAGDRPDKQLEIYNRLRAAGKIGAPTQTQKQIPEADRTRVAIGDGEAKRPDSWKEADRKVARRLKQVR